MYPAASNPVRKVKPVTSSNPTTTDHGNRLCLILMFFGIVLCAGIADAQEDFFANHALTVEGSQIDYAVNDLNDDGLNDFLFFHLRKTDNKETRLFSIFYQTRTGFSNTADQCFEIDEHAIVYCISDVDSKPGKEIVFFTSAGIYYYAAEQGKYDATAKRLIKTNSIFKLPDSSFLEYYDFARDINEDGIDEMIVPHFEQFVIYSRGDQGTYNQHATLDVGIQTTILGGREVSRYIVTSYGIPNLVVADYNNDKKPDLIFIQERQLTVFFQTAPLVFPREAAVVRELGEKLSQTYSLQIRNLNIFKRDRFQDKTGINVLEDLNNDGLMDVIIETFSLTESVFNPKKTLKIFFGRPDTTTPSKGALFLQQPDNTIVTTGFPGRNMILDLNDDRFKEIIIPSVELGFWKVIKILLSGQADVDVFVYNCSGTGRYGQAPESRIHFSVDIDKKGRKIPVSSFSGDFNGDGSVDHLGSKGDALTITFNPKNGSLKSTPDILFPIQIPDNGLKIEPHYVNDDALSDVVIIYADPSSDALPGEKNVCLLINRNGGRY